MKKKYKKKKKREEKKKKRRKEKRRKQKRRVENRREEKEQKIDCVKERAYILQTFYQKNMFKNTLKFKLTLLKN